jgi:Family of unknown function (DUF6627)
MKRGAWGNVAYGGNENPPRNRKGGAGNPPPKGRRAPVLSQPSLYKLGHQRFELLLSNYRKEVVPMKGFLTDPVVRGIAMMLVVVMGLVSLVPRVEASFVPTEQSASSVSRQEDMATIQKALEQKLVKERLKDLGYTEEEIKARLDRLSDAEVQSLASQLDSLMPAGGWEAAVLVLVLVAILIVVMLMWTGHKIAI